MGLEPGITHVQKKERNTIIFRFPAEITNDTCVAK